MSVLALIFLTVLPAKADHVAPIVTDRPSKTDSPIPVEEGHFQIEADIANWTRDVNVDRSVFAQTNFKAGLSSDRDVQFIVPTVVRDSGVKKTGFGDIVVRVKQNFMGADGKGTAFALVPYVKTPTASKGLGNDAFEAGFSTPVTFTLNDKYTLCTQVQINWLRTPANDSRMLDLDHSIVLTRSFSDTTSAYVEWFNSTATLYGSPWVSTADFGFGWLSSPKMQWDVGFNVGLTDAAKDINVFTGWAYKI